MKTPDEVQVNLSFPIGLSLQDLIQFKKNDDRCKELVQKCLDDSLNDDELDELKGMIYEYGDERMTNCPRVQPIIHNSTIDILVD